MNDSMNVFVTESNVDLYLSKAYGALDREERDLLLRLVVEEQSRMGGRLEHVENAKQRLDDCRERIRHQRGVVDALDHQHPNRAREEFLLDTFEKALAVLREHQHTLDKRDRDTDPDTSASLRDRSAAESCSRPIKFPPTPR